MLILERCAPTHSKNKGTRSLFLSFSLSLLSHSRAHRLFSVSTDSWPVPVSYLARSAKKIASNPVRRILSSPLLPLKVGNRRTSLSISHSVSVSLSFALLLSCPASIDDDLCFPPPFLLSLCSLPPPFGRPLALFPTLTTRAWCVAARPNVNDEPPGRVFIRATEFQAALVGAKILTFGLVEVGPSARRNSGR